MIRTAQPLAKRIKTTFEGKSVYRVVVKEDDPFWDEEITGYSDLREDSCVLASHVFVEADDPHDSGWYLRTEVIEQKGG